MGRAGLEEGYGEERASYCTSLFTGEWSSEHSTGCKSPIRNCSHLGIRVILREVCCLFIVLSIQPNLNLFASSDGCDQGPSMDRSAQARQAKKACKPGILVKWQVSV